MAPEAPFSAVARSIGSQWRGLPEARRQEYRDAFGQAKREAFLSPPVGVISSQLSGAVPLPTGLEGLPQCFGFGLCTVTAS